MIIQQTRDLQEILRCMPFETEVRKKGRDKIKLQKMLLSITRKLDYPLFGFWIAYESEKEINPDDKIIGYCVAEIILLPELKGLYIYRVYAKQIELRKKFEKILKAWKRENKVKYEYMSVSSNIKAFQRKYGFIPIAVIMRRI